MKTKIFLLAALLMASTLSATAGNDDTLKVFRIYFTQKLNAVQFTGYSKVELVNDSVEYIEYCDPTLTGAPKGMIYSLGGRNSNRLKLNTPSGYPKLRLHLMMEAANKISTEDYAQVDVICPPSLAKMSVSAEDYSKVDIMTQPGTDTLRARNIVLKAEDYSTVSLKTPCIVDEIGLQAEDYANVNVTFCKGDKLTSFEQDHAHVTVESHQMAQTEFGALFQDEEGRTPTVDKMIADHKADRIVKKASGHTTDFRFDFLWGFHNWGTTPYNGLMRMKDGYALNTSFSSYQLEAVYYPFVNRHWRLGVGLGYGSDVYKFAHDRVVLLQNAEEQTMFHNMPLDDGGQWSTRLVARYIELPLMVRWSPSARSGFFIGLAAIPGLNYNGKHTGLKHTAEYTNGDYNNKASAAEILNPFRLDARLSIGWQRFYAFAQVATLPVNTGMSKDVYPFKVGLAISLGDE